MQTVEQRLESYCSTLSSAIQSIPRQIGAAIPKGVDLLLRARQIVTFGVGKSGAVATKFAATLMSLRFNARCMSPVDIHHGDAGVLGAEDVAVLISKSGETTEILRAQATLSSIGCQTLVITTSRNSRLATTADLAVITEQIIELDSDGLLPTTSVVVANVVCDLLALEMLHQLKTSPRTRLESSHPDGTIGAMLRRRVSDVVHSGAAAPFVLPSATVSDALVKLSTTALGVVCVVDEGGSLHGILTDGDVRRLASNNSLVLDACVTTVMTRSPVVIAADDSLYSALTLMERRERQLSALPVMKGAVCYGVVRLHDIVRLQV